MRALEAQLVQQNAQIAALMGAVQVQQNATNAAIQAQTASAAAPPVQDAAERGAHTARLGKQPPQFKGSAEDWPEWSFKIRRYLGAVDSELRRELDDAEAQPEDPLLADMAAETKARAQKLAYMLTMFSEDRALTRIRNTNEPDNGYMIWRAFVTQWEPRVKGRFRAMLRRILAFQFEGGPLTEKLEEWERLISDYEQQTSEVISGDIKAAVLSEQLGTRPCICIWV